MGNISHVQSFVRYNYQAHRHLWDCIDQLNDIQFVEEIAYSIGSLRNHYVHLIGVDSRWLARLQGNPVPTKPPEDQLNTRSIVKARWLEVETTVLGYLDSVTENNLFEVIEYDMPHRGGIKRNTRAEILLHLVNHGTDHRAQMLSILHHMGAPTFEQDYAIHLWSQNGS